MKIIYSSYKWSSSKRRYKIGYIPKEPIQLYDTLKACIDNINKINPKRVYIYQICDYHIHKQYIGRVDNRHTLKEANRVLKLKELWLPLTNSQIIGDYCGHFVARSKELKDCEMPSLPWYPMGYSFAQVDTNGKIIKIIHSSERDRYIKISQL